MKFDPASLGLDDTTQQTSPEDLMEILIEVKFAEAENWMSMSVRRQDLHNIINLKQQGWDKLTIEKICLYTFEGAECNIRCEFDVFSGTWSFV